MFLTNSWIKESVSIRKLDPDAKSEQCWIATYQRNPLLWLRDSKAKGRTELKNEWSWKGEVRGRQKDFETLGEK